MNLAPRLTESPHVKTDIINRDYYKVLTNKVHDAVFEGSKLSLCINGGCFCLNQLLCKRNVFLLEVFKQRSRPTALLGLAVLI